ncbi:hypothetical protein L6E12_33505 [Actinokineospora sp. PR83]|uniref:hypothetical protein n=1 Tax=Actinokineospora sp. PR83 TaxID=2884908 RepID=UPI001F2741AF|nr:hypothetical protein [Actinokineospora sp. PR83]MCG8920689.1 hypothetical protein [Actinokineospora sp. PR83]
MGDLTTAVARRQPPVVLLWAYDAEVTRHLRFPKQLDLGMAVPAVAGPGWARLPPSPHLRRPRTLAQAVELVVAVARHCHKT